MQYEQKAWNELLDWQKEMRKRPSLLGHLSKRVQQKLNSYIPEKVHTAVTAAIREMVKAVLFGSRITTAKPQPVISLEKTEKEVELRIRRFRRTASVEGGLTGAGGFLWVWPTSPSCWASS